MNAGRRGRILFRGAALIFLAALVWAAWPRERLLLARATRIADAKYRPHLWDYFWLSDHEVMLFRSSPSDPYQPLRLDLWTGQETPMEPLNALLRKERKETGSTPEQQWLSPDRRWLVWTESSTARGFYHVAAVDGSRHRRWPRSRTADPEFRDVVWQPDSKAWVEFQRNPGRGMILAGDGVFHLAGRGAIWGTAVAYPVSTAGEPKGRTVKLPQTLFMVHGFLRDGRLLLLDFTTLDKREDRLEAFTLALDGREPPHHYAMPIPRNARSPGDVLLSPQGDRIAWMFDTMPGMPTRTPAAWLERIETLFGLRPSAQISLWVTRTDGSDMREVGHINAPPIPHRGVEVPGQVRWMSDGKRLSFIYHDALYTVPVDD